MIVFRKQTRNVGIAFVGHLIEHRGGLLIGCRSSKPSAAFDAAAHFADQFVSLHAVMPSVLGVESSTTVRLLLSGINGDRKSHAACCVTKVLVNIKTSVELSAAISTVGHVGR